MLPSSRATPGCDSGDDSLPSGPTAVSRIPGRGSRNRVEPRQRLKDWYEVIDDSDYGGFVRSELPGLLRFAHLVTGDPHAAEEAVQAALVATLRRWPGLSVTEGWRPGPYVRRAIVNNHIKTARRWSNRIRLGPVPDQALPDEITAWIEHDRMVRALRTLPPRQRAVLVL